MKANYRVHAIGQDKCTLRIILNTVSRMPEDAHHAGKEQVGPCSIVCATCPLGNGTVAEVAKQLKQHLDAYQVAMWAPNVSGGSEINFDDLYKSLDWIHTFTRCVGCEEGGGPPDCTIRTCARGRGYELCSSCDDLDDCTKFEWLGEHAQRLKSTLSALKGKSKLEALTELTKTLAS